MKTSIAAVLGAAFTAGTTLLPTPAHANCTQTIYAERSVSNGTTTQLLGRNFSSSTNGWLGTTANVALGDAIVAAVAQRSRVTVTGDATPCPALPEAGFAKLGAIIQLIISP